jgi:hypothetical protein
MLGAMFNGTHQIKKDNEGRVFIDRNGVSFEIILEWLRTHHFPEMSDKEHVALDIELDYFVLPDIVKEHNRIELTKFQLTVDDVYTAAKAQNTAEAVIDGNYNTGACAFHDATGATITATFPKPVTISGVTVAGYFGSPSTWHPSNGLNAKVEYFNDNKWIQVGAIPKSFGIWNQKETHVLKWTPRTASKWRINKDTPHIVTHPRRSLGLSHLIFQ